MNEKFALSGYEFIREWLRRKAQWGIRRIKLGISEVFNGVSPNGKAQDFDSCISGFESRYPSLVLVF